MQERRQSNERAHSREDIQDLGNPEVSSLRSLQNPPRHSPSPGGEDSAGDTESSDVDDAWDIVGILAERKVKRKGVRVAQYKVEFEPHPITGQKYPPEWVFEVGSGAIQEWQEKKAKKAKQKAQRKSKNRRPGTSSQGSRVESTQKATGYGQDAAASHAGIQVSADVISTHEAKRKRATYDKSALDRGAPPPLETRVTALRPDVDSQESQAPRAANFRREHANSVECHPSKRRKLGRTASPSDIAPSITTASSVASGSTSPLAAYQALSVGECPRSWVIELHKNPNFDPSEYLSVSGTQSTSQSLSQLESEDCRIIVPSSSQHSQRSRSTIPDSQDLSGLTGVQVEATSVRPIAVPLPASTRVIADSQDDSQPSAGTSLPLVGLESWSRTKHHDRNGSWAEEPTPPEDSDIPSHQQASPRGAISINNPISQVSSKPQDTGSLPQSSSSSVAAGTSQLSRRVPTYHSQPILCHEQGWTASSHSLPVDNRDDQQLTVTDFVPVSRAEDLADGENLSQAAQVVTRDPRFLAGSSGESHQDSGEISTPSNSSGSLAVIGRQVTLCPSKTMDEQRKPSPSEPRRSAQADLMDIFNASFAIDPSVPPVVQDAQDADLADTTDTTQAGVIIGSDVAMPSIPAALTIQSQPMGSRQLQAQALGSPGQIEPAIGQGPDRPTIITPDEAFSETLSAGLVQGDIPQGTVSPAEILRFTEPDPTFPSMPSILDDAIGSFAEPESSHQILVMGQGDSVRQDESSPDSSSATEGAREIITLPFHARTRDIYSETLSAHRADVQRYSKHFKEGISEGPNGEIVQRIDDLFKALQNVCDFPPDITGTSIEELPPLQKAKYACDANPKFNFIFELLQGIERDTNVLIIARSAEILRLLYPITQALQIECTCNAIKAHESSFSSSAAHVRLALPSEQLEESEFDLVIGFDSSLQSSDFMASIDSLDPTMKQPLLLLLVTTYALEHFDLCVPRDLDDLERRYAILYGVVAARKMLSDPDRGYMEPHEIAKLFYEYRNGVLEHTGWEPVAMPDELLMSYDSTQGQSQAPVVESVEADNVDPRDGDNGRKRKHDELDNEDSKRPKMTSELDLAGTQEPPLPEEVRDLIDAVTLTEAQLSARPTLMEVPVVVMQELAKRLNELEREVVAADNSSEIKDIVNRLEKQNKGYERSINKIYDSNRTALEDRSQFEREKRQAELNLAKAVEARQKDEEKFLKRIAELDIVVARLLGNGENPNTEETPLARNEKALRDAQDKIRTLEKRLENSQNERDYTNSLYQTASTAASQATGEIDQLRARLAKAEEEAAQNKVRIHEIYAANSVRGYVSKIAELETLLKEREIELDRIRDELRVTKNGRRETRQTSVPRSPRMGMMSPRAPARSYPGSASRGGSPAPAVGMEVGNVAGGTVLPGMQLFPQTPANGRWTHLRE